jgi:AP-2 complex subunit mu-1
VDYKILVKSNFSAKLFANNVVVRIPVPTNASGVNTRVGAGKAKYVPAENMIVWK